MEAFRLRDPALTQLAQIIHDINLKDQKFGRAEETGIDVLIRSLGD
jgi:chromate resistance exported protein